MMASHVCRSSCARRRPASPDTHRDSPVAVAIFPSRLIANFAVTNGSPVRMRWRNPSIVSAASSARSPTVTSTPAARSSAAPAPFTMSFGSMTAECTSAMPASSSARVHGGVRPKWQHGSSVV